MYLRVKAPGKMFALMFCMCYFIIFANAKPNFVLILTDDQDLLLNSLISMKHTLRLIAKHGKVFTNAFANSPICCPSRSTILTGQYAHNTGVVNNSLSGNCSSKAWQKYHEPFTVASILKEEGYVSFYAGKYLNQYGSKKCGGTKHIPSGYDWWIGLKGNSKYYNYTLSVNGSAIRFVDDYLTDVLANYTIQFLNNKLHTKPFFMVVAPPASHAPFVPAKRHRNALPNVKVLRNPSFNYTPTEKHWIVRMPPTHLPDDVKVLDYIQRHRLETLLAVDEMVEAIVKKLTELDILNNTYIIFTSDNGFHIGQFTQPWDKRQPYETDIRVPMMISGPNIPSETIDDYPVAMIDLTPTILDLANVVVPPYMDGKSFKNALFSKSNDNFDRHIFIEYWGEGNKATVDSGCPLEFESDLAECTLEQWCKCQDSKNNTYACILELSSNSQNVKFCHFKDGQEFIEAYNLTKDPYELVNIYKRMNKETINGYVNLLGQFEHCSGRSCEL